MMAKVELGVASMSPRSALNEQLHELVAHMTSRFEISLRNLFEEEMKTMATMCDAGVSPKSKSDDNAISKDSAEEDDCQESTSKLKYDFALNVEANESANVVEGTECNDDEIKVMRALSILRVDAVERVKAALEARINAETQANAKFAKDSSRKLVNKAEDEATKFQAVARGGKAPVDCSQGIEEHLSKQTSRKEVAEAIVCTEAGRRQISSTRSTMSPTQNVSSLEQLETKAGSKENLAVDIEDLAAAKIQASFRGRAIAKISMAEAKTSVQTAKVTKQYVPATKFQARVTVIKEVLAATMIQASFRGWALRNKRTHTVTKISSAEERAKPLRALQRRSSSLRKRSKSAQLQVKMSAVALMCTPHICCTPWSPRAHVPVESPDTKPEQPVSLISGDVIKTLMTQAVADLLRDYLPGNLRVPGLFDWHLRYSPKSHGVSMSTVYRNVSESSKTITILQDAQGHVFGNFATAAWDPGTAFYGSGEAFVFAAGPLCDDISQIQVYPWTCQNNFIMYADSKFMAMGSGDSGHALLIREDLLNGHSFPTPTFGNPTLAASSEFVIRDLEIWSLEEHDW